MNTQPTVESKLADWTSAFTSIANKQSEQAQILMALITGLRSKMIVA